MLTYRDGITPEKQQMEWLEHFNVRMHPQEVTAYDEDDYKGRFWDAME